MNDAEYKVFNTLSCREVADFWSQFEKGNPFQGPFEQLAEVLANEAGDDTIEVSIWHLTRNLHLSWAAARAVFGESATTEIAWRICEQLMKSVEEASRLEQAHRAETSNGSQEGSIQIRPKLLKKVEEADRKFCGAPRRSTSHLVEAALKNELARLNDFDKQLEAREQVRYLRWLEQEAKHKEWAKLLKEMTGVEPED